MHTLLLFCRGFGIHTQGFVAKTERTESIRGVGASILNGVKRGYVARNAPTLEKLGWVR